MAPATRLPVTVVTGFLGAGKTTVLRHLLLNSRQRLAVLVNEFGEVGIDGALLRSCGFCPDDELEGRLVELANGCLCCTVQDDFLPTMERLLLRADQLDGIVVETSGLALPEPLVAAFGWPSIRTRTRVHGVVTVVDGQALAAGQVVADASALEAQRAADPSLDHLEAIEDLFEDQLQAADLVLISRADQLQGDELDAVRSRLQRHCRAGTALLPVANGAVDSELLLGPALMQRPDQAHADHDHDDHDHDDHDEADHGHHGHHDHHDHPDPLETEHDHHDHSHVEIESLALDLPGHWQQDRLEAALQQLLSQQAVIRLKGWLSMPAKQRLLQIQAVGPRLHCWYEGESQAPAAGHQHGQLCLVLLGFGLNRQGIIEALQLAGD
ncbi:MAG: cobalamin biosynthesis protein CobW [Cyanobacteriota bacterium]|nr:cobalamin biosynthesis protein CobW [Cyanobacteriota bacterium]